MSCEFDVRVVPRSSQEKVALQTDGALKVWVHAAPADGQANEAVCARIADQLGLAKSKVVLVRGHASRSKRIRIEGIELSDALKRLSL